MTTATVPGRGSQAGYPAAMIGIAFAIAAALLLWQLSTAIAGLFYVCFFLILAWARPGLALMLIFAAAPFQQDLSGGGPLKFSIAEINLILTFIVCLIRNTSFRKPLIIGPLLVPAFAYLVICCLSSVVSWRGGDAVVSFFQMLLYMFAAVLVFASFPEGPQDFYPGLIAVICISAALGVSVFASGSGYVWGMHKNGVGGTLAAAVIICVELWLSSQTRRERRWLLTAMLLIGAGLLFTLSRGAWMAACTGLLFLLFLRGDFRAMLRCIAVLVPLIVCLWMFLPEESKHYALNFDSSAQNISDRYKTIAVAKGYFLQHPLLGAGLGLRKELDATNIVLITLAETGVAGLAAFALVHWVIVRMIYRGSRALPARSPWQPYLAIGGALLLGRLAHGLVDHYWSRGALMTAWAGVGMATRGIMRGAPVSLDAGTGPRVSQGWNGR